jgi:2,4'-dihydroxyacetophenone dioxygenase
MNASEIKWEERQVGGSRFADGSAIIRPAELKWTPGPVENAQFRLTHVDRSSGMWTALVKIDANVTLPRHFVHGEVHYYVLEGDMTVDDVWLGVGGYFLDSGGQARNIAGGSAGTTFLAMYSGGLSAVDRDGKPTGAYIDANRAYDMAKANAAADHLGSLQLN